MIYLDNAATSFPKPESVYAAMDDYNRRRAANPGRAGHRMAVELDQAIAAVRHRFTRFFQGSDFRRMIFTLNCTDALNIAIKGLLRPGDHVITTVQEHNSVSRPLYGFKQRGIIELSLVECSPEGYIDPQDIQKCLRPQTRLIVLAHASNVSGAVQPIGEIGRIARQAGAFLLVDAAQSAGVIEIDVERERIDLLAFAGHKALYGPQGTGGLWVGERVTLEPWREGGTGKDSESVHHPLDLPFRLEAGTPNSGGILALGAGLEFVQQQTPRRIHEHEMRLAQQLMDFLLSHQGDGFRLYGPRRSENRVAVVAFSVRGLDPAEVGNILDSQFGIAVRTGLHCAPNIHRHFGCFPEGTVRVSPGYFNTEEDMQALIRALEEIVGGA